MTDSSKKHRKHGKETYIEEYGRFVVKRPLEGLGGQACVDWLARQHRTKEVTDAVRSIGNPTYNIPEMHFVHDGDLQVLEDFAPGVPLTSEVYQSLSRRQKYEIVVSLASFLVDMNESKPVKTLQKGYKLSCELKLEALDRFITNKMADWFPQSDVKYMSQIRDMIVDVEYDTRPAWSHGDLNKGNVLYDVKASKLWIIDFAEADYKMIYHDLFSPLAVDLDICKPVYDTYKRLHDSGLYQMPGMQNDRVRDIMKYRAIVVWLNRFVKASRDLHKNTITEHGKQNNQNKLLYMVDVMQQIYALDQSR